MKPGKDVSNQQNPEEFGKNSRRIAAPNASLRNTKADVGEVLGVVAGCRAGNRGAQRRLYDMFQRHIYRLMVRMVGADEGPDMTQQVFLHVFRNIEKFSGRGRFDRWLYRVAMNEAYQHLRRRQRHQHASLAYEPDDPAKAANRKTDEKDLTEQALARLEPELRSIFLLREIEELSYRDIAESLGIPEGTVGSRLNRARRELKEHLINLGWEP